MTAITKDTFHLATKTTFIGLAYGDKAHQMFAELEAQHGLFHKSNSSSKYIIVDDLVYRMADHWGNVASCDWKLPKQNYLQQTNQTYTLAVSPLSDFISLEASKEELKQHHLRMYDKVYA